MPNKCSVFGCFINYKEHEEGHVFGIPTKNEDLKERWIKFINRQDITDLF